MAVIATVGQKLLKLFDFKCEKSAYRGQKILLTVDGKNSLPNDGKIILPRTGSELLWRTACLQSYPSSDAREKTRSVGYHQFHCMKLAEKTNPPVRVAVGAGYKALMLLQRILPDTAVENILRKLYLS